MEQDTSTVWEDVPFEDEPTLDSAENASSRLVAFKMYKVGSLLCRPVKIGSERPDAEYVRPAFNINGGVVPSQLLLVPKEILIPVMVDVLMYNTETMVSWELRV